MWCTDTVVGNEEVEDEKEEEEAVVVVVGNEWRLVRDVSGFPVCLCTGILAPCKGATSVGPFDDALTVAVAEA